MHFPRSSAVHVAAYQCTADQLRARSTAAAPGRLLPNPRLPNPRLRTPRLPLPAQASTKKLEKMSERQHGGRAANPELPSVALRGGGDEAITDEIRQIVRENEELEAAVTQHQDTKLHLEKLQNEKKDLGRKLKELKEEDRCGPRVPWRRQWSVRRGRPWR